MESYEGYLYRRPGGVPPYPQGCQELGLNREYRARDIQLTLSAFFGPNTGKKTGGSFLVENRLRIS
jgi:hypothetical protein